MVKKEAAEKVIRKLAETSKETAESCPGVSIIIDRRKALPQPDFSHYREAGSYPGTSYFFVGHSYNVEHNCCGAQFNLKRKNAIKKVLQQATKNNALLVKTAILQPEFFAVLSRFERDWLGRLPEGAMIGPAIDQDGKKIVQSFTVWRKEQRKTSVKSKQNEKVVTSAAGSR
jgi:hypothetical protein